mmetsp:Transcript_22616/g.67355  ORF Transcript_22616/g.67355 Transcript_22616/m.67355 type:complete len:337 (-) Transcript_22616:634-1644(-)
MRRSRAASDRSREKRSGGDTRAPPLSPPPHPAPPWSLQPSVTSSIVRADGSAVAPEASPLRPPAAEAAPATKARSAALAGCGATAASSPRAAGPASRPPHASPVCDRSLGAADDDACASGLNPRSDGTLPGCPARPASLQPPAAGPPPEGRPVAPPPGHLSATVEQLAAVLPAADARRCDAPVRPVSLRSSSLAPPSLPERDSPAAARRGGRASAACRNRHCPATRPPGVARSLCDTSMRASDSRGPPRCASSAASAIRSSPPRLVPDRSSSRRPDKESCAPPPPPLLPRRVRPIASLLLSASPSPPWPGAHACASISHASSATPPVSAFHARQRR